MQLLLFPELSLTGYRLGTGILDVAMSRDDPVVRELAELAPDMTVALGIVEEGPAAQLYNTCIVLHGGRVAHLHRKLNLPNYGNLEEGKLFAGRQLRRDVRDRGALAPERADLRGPVEPLARAPGDAARGHPCCSPR